MTLDRDLKLQIDLAGYQLLVQANRLNCDNAFAREAHDNVIATPARSTRTGAQQVADQAGAATGDG